MTFYTVGLLCLYFKS